MEDKLYEKNENTEELEKVEAEAIDNAEAEGSAETKWSMIKSRRAEKSEADTVEIEKVAEPELEIIPEEDIKPVEVPEYDDTPSTKEMMKRAKAERKAARREVKKNTKDHHDDGSIFKMKPIRDTINLVYLLLLIAVIAIPVGLLVYTIMAFFL